MNKATYYTYLGPLLLLFLVLASCEGQVNPGPPVAETGAREHTPVIVGTPPSLLPAHNPYNDTGLVSQYVRTIFQDSKGHYWFGPAGQSVCRYDGDTLRYFSGEAFFRGNDKVGQANAVSIHATAEDRAGNLWFGTSAGVVKYNGTTFRSYTEKHGLINTDIGRGSILVDRTGTVWVGTRKGVFRYDPFADRLGSPCFSRFDSLPPIHVKDILEDKEGNLWFATAQQGVFRYDGKTVTKLAARAELGLNVAGGIAQDAAGHLWFTMKGGICRYDGETFTDYTVADGLGGSEIWGLLVEDSGIIWITARGSTTRFDPSLPLSEAFTVFTVSDGLNCCVQSMFEDRAGAVWFGTGQGVYRFGGGGFWQVRRVGGWE